MPRLPPRRSAVGDLMSRFSADMENVERALTQAIQSLVQAVAGILVGLVVMFAMDWRLSLASIATWFVFVLGPGLIGPRARRASSARARRTSAGSPRRCKRTWWAR